MAFIPRDQVSLAREMDLLTYLRRFEPQELVDFYNVFLDVMDERNIEDLEFHFSDFDNPLFLYDKNNGYKIDIIWNPQNINEVSMNFNRCE